MATIFYPGANGTVYMIADATESENHQATSQVSSHPIDKGAKVSDHVDRDNDRLSLVLWFSDTPIMSTGDDFYEGSAPSPKSVSLEIAARVRRRSGNPILTSPGSPGGALRDAPLTGEVLNLNGTPAATVAILALNTRIDPIPPTFEPQPLESYGEPQAATVLTWSEEFKRSRRVYEELIRLKNEVQLVSVSTALRDYANMVIVGVNPTRDVATGNVLKVTLDLEQVTIVGSKTVQITAPLQTRGYKQKSKGAAPKKEVEQKPAERASGLVKRIGGGSATTGQDRIVNAVNFVKGL